MRSKPGENDTFELPFKLKCCWKIVVAENVKAESWRDSGHCFTVHYEHGTKGLNSTQTF